MISFRGNPATVRRASGRPLAMLLALWVSTACGILSPDEWDERRDALDAARARWGEQGIHDYSIELHRTSMAFGSGVEVVVRADEVESITVLWSFPDPPTSEPSGRTVDQLFDEVAALIDERPDDLHVEYDGTFGYPTEVSVDPIRGAIDDEYGFGMSDLVPFVEGG